MTWSVNVDGRCRSAHFRKSENPWEISENIMFSSYRQAPDIQWLDRVKCLPTIVQYGKGIGTEESFLTFHHSIHHRFKATPPVLGPVIAAKVIITKHYVYMCREAFTGSSKKGLICIFFYVLKLLEL